MTEANTDVTKRPTDASGNDHAGTSYRRWALNTTTRCSACGAVPVDELTGAMTKSLWMEAARAVVSQARAHGGSLALLMIDLDRFKSINDTYGHVAGDTLLQAVGTAIRDTVDGAMTGRYGGHADEFIVLVRDDGAAAVRLAARVQQAIARLRVVVRSARDATALVAHRTASIGVAVLQHTDGPIDDLLDALLLDADAALRVAKRAGRSRIVVGPVSVPVQDTTLLTPPSGGSPTYARRTWRRVPGAPRREKVVQIRRARTHGPGQLTPTATADTPLAKQANSEEWPWLG